MTPLQRALRHSKPHHGRQAIWTPVAGYNADRPGITGLEAKDWVERGFAEVIETVYVGNGKIRKLVSLTDAGKAAAMAGYTFHAPPPSAPDVKATGFVVIDGGKEESVPDVVAGLAAIKERPHGTELRRLPDNALLAVR